MPPVNKLKSLPPPLERDIAIEALAIFLLERKFDDIDKISHISNEDRKNFESKLSDLKDKFSRKYKQEFTTIINDYFLGWESYLGLARSNISPTEMYERYIDLLKQSEVMPLRFFKNWVFGKNHWVYKGFVYDIQGIHSDDEIKGIILGERPNSESTITTLPNHLSEGFWNEEIHQVSSNLAQKFWDEKIQQTSSDTTTYERPRIPEKIRVEVWRRDGGKCARCGSRERLEYDHIVPISKGGSNTSRNIELLCEKCNRSKSNNVV